MQKTHKRIFSILLLAISIFCFLMVGAQTAFAATTKTGLQVGAKDLYSVSNVSMPMPSTYEAVVTLPKDYTSRAGVIISDYKKDKKPCFSFEVYENGAPRIYMYDGKPTKHDVTFDQVNVCTGNPVHIAITLGDGTWSCYVDGVLAQTISKAKPETFDISSFCLGGDFRTNNAQYFRGSIQKVALYSSVRTADEVLLDAKASTFDTTNLLTAYDLSNNPINKMLETIPSVNNSALNLTYSGEYFNEWISEVEEPTDYDYSFAVIGDIQTLNATEYPNYHEHLSTMYQWIRDNAESKKIKYAVGLGDVTENNHDEEYQRANEVYSLIDGVVPYSIIRGNHDRSSGHSSAKFETYITKAKHGDEITGSYDGTMLNTYRILQIGKVKYMFMNLDFLLKDEVLAWAGEVISANPDCQVIVSTHIYMSQTGAYYTLEGSSGLSGKYKCKNNGQGLWDKLLSKHENIVMLLCGHNPTDNIYYRNTKTGDAGNTVTEILIDPQTTDLNYNGTGLVAMFYFSEDGTKLDVRYYSTVKDAYFKANNQFSLTIDTSGVETPPEHTHSYTINNHNSEQHWLECSCGQKSSVASHNLVNGACSCGYVSQSVTPNPNPNPNPNPDTPVNPNLPSNPDTPINPNPDNDKPSSNEPKDNTGSIIAIAVAGTVVVAGGGVGTFFFIRKRKLK